MMTQTERAAQALVAGTAFTPARPGFVGVAVDLLLSRPVAPPPGRVPLRHGFLYARSPRVVTVSSPPSPGLDSAVARTRADLASALPLLTGDDVAVLPCAADDVDPAAPALARTAGVRVGLEPGLDDDGQLGLDRRWSLAVAVAPVLAAAFANSPLRHGRPTGWRSTRQAGRLLPRPARDPHTSWADHVLDAPDDAGLTFRAWARRRGTARPTAGDLARHVAAMRSPVAARGHLELDVADGQPGAGWQVPVAVITTLLDEPHAAARARAAAEPLTARPRGWEIAARDGLTDPLLARAARECFVAAYEGLARRGAARDTRDAVATFIDRYVMRGRCPADDVLAAA